MSSRQQQDPLLQPQRQAYGSVDEEAVPRTRSFHPTDSSSLAASPTHRRQEQTNRLAASAAKKAASAQTIKKFHLFVIYAIVSERGFFVCSTPKLMLSFFRSM